MNVLVQRAGFSTSVQDLGRVGYRDSGVSVGGALDANALRVANLLVGNEVTAAGLEVALGTVRLRFADQRLVAWGGGGFKVDLADAAVSAGHVTCVTPGEELVVRPPRTGGRAWLAISGGLDVPVVLGSRSTDLRSHFGGFDGRSLRDGDTLALGRQGSYSAAIAKRLAGSRVSTWSAPSAWTSMKPMHPFLRIVRGADWARFAASEVTSFGRESFTIASDSDRVGLRLSGCRLKRAANDELLSEAVTPGTIQVPPDGNPIILLGDCQTIGGYPKIAHVITVDMPAAAQLWPGEVVRFAEVSLQDAERLLFERERDLAWFRAGLALKVA